VFINQQVVLKITKGFNIRVHDVWIFQSASSLTVGSPAVEALN
jgi:hypothetical protein